MSLLDTVIKQASKRLNQSSGVKEQLAKNELAQNETELIERREQAEKLIHNKSLMSSAAAVVPIPGVDVGADMKLMADIIEQINRVYGLSHKQVNGMADDMKQKVMFTAAKQGSDFIGKRISKTVVAILFKAMARRELAKQSKWVPVVGQAISGSISYYMMKKMGQAHLEKCDKVSRELMAAS